ncbi:hypothetical protein HIM_08889 [Hirsutella minnesotensis 3608]|uniref:ATP-grasp domain-containing protein n=1 Tax=Hirsutella minnesotensis 3608 TaxID=1043627 RepID=A0A0F7ZY17_9HYPO|nr:hypothetical protein HIM_08889 [Hirsutella minnesotensis 3608]
MASPALIPALPPTLSEPGGELPVDSADEFSESDDCDDFHDNDDWDGQPWEVEFPSDSPLLTTSYESFDRLLDVLNAAPLMAAAPRQNIKKSKKGYLTSEGTGKDRETDSTIVLLLFLPRTLPEMSACLPKPKFIYEDALEVSDERDGTPALRLQTVPQQYGFTAGKMPLIALDVWNKQDVSQSNDASPTGYPEIEFSFRQLSSDQRPILSFARRPADITLQAGSIAAVLGPDDELLHLPHLIDPEDHYEVLSKRGLALSGLPTPESIIIDTNLQPGPQVDEPVLQSEVTRMIKSIEEIQRPYIIKLQQSAASKGAFKVQTSSDLESIRKLLNLKLKGMLLRVNETNSHLRSCSLIVQELVQGHAVALSLFITKTGRAIFIACCEQIFNQKGHWVGASISYKSQVFLRQRYADTADRIARFLHQKGYYGPTGADVMTDQSGRQLIVDLNVRITTSFHLGPLAGHFTQRGCFNGMALRRYFHCPRDTFELAFENELGSGILIITAWAYNELEGLNYAAIIFGAKDSAELDGFAKRVDCFAAAQSGTR